jgi:hypothetical protein
MSTFEPLAPLQLKSDTLHALNLVRIHGELDPAGRRVLVTVTGCEVVPVAPSSSVTVSVTVYVPPAA